MRLLSVLSSSTLRALAVLALVGSPLGAQTSADIVRGRVTDDSARAVAGATVMITRGPDRLTQETTTDSTGAFSSRFEEGTGDYLVYVKALGFRTERKRVQRRGTEHELVVDFALARDLTVLAAVKVTATRPERASNRVEPHEPETGSSEAWKQGVEGQVSPVIAGDLTAVAGTMSNVTMTPAGASILGSGSESNLTTLNGMGLPAGSIPRAANTETRVTGATFDATRGGFAGANVDVRLGPGDRRYQRRQGYITLDPRQLGFTDAVSRSLGTISGGFRGSVGADGELIRRALTYNVALDAARSVSDPSTLVSADADVLRRAGVAPDSVARLIAIAGPLGIPLVGAGVPGGHERTSVSFLGRLDDTRDTLQTRALTGLVGISHDGAIGFGPLAAPASAGERRERTLGAQLTLGAFVGAGRRVLTETRLAASAVHADFSPYRAFPAAGVIVRSTRDDATTDITSVTLGGASSVTTDDGWTIEGSNETAWNANGRRHRFKAMLWGRADGLRQAGVENALGRYSFNSLADLAAGEASSFTRTLAQPARSGSVWNTAAAFAHTWSPSRFLSVIYGARLEADGFSEAPARNAALEGALGVRTGAAPARLHVSPRVGFTYTYNRDRENGSGMSVGDVGRFFRTPTGTLRGGIGEFRDLLRPGVLADARAATGLADGTLVLSCIGGAVPPPQWSSFDAGASPTQCVDGSGALAERAPEVMLLDPSYDVPRSWRSSLDWSATVRRMLLRIGGLVSYDLAQPGLVDVNFSGEQRGSLPGERGRPLYVSADAIDATTGAVSASESRRSGEFGRVMSRVSDLRGYGAQLSVSLAPDMFKFRNRHELFASASYTLQSSRRQYRGFDGAAAGDPRTVEWAPSANDARHVVVVSGGIRSAKLGVVTMFARAQSGLPFTPLVQGDVNGDGRSLDRAFVPNPLEEADPAVAAGIRRLLADGSPTAKRCLGRYLGVVAGRNGCRGPWTQSLNVQWRTPVPSRWGGRVRPALYFQNVLAGLDQLVHGSGSMRGWGSPTSPDPVLLVPRGFDPSAGRFRYDVNPRFADTRPDRMVWREPFRIVLDFSLELSTDFRLQELRRAVEPVRVAGGWRRRSADSLTAFYLDGTSSIHKALLRESDSLFLSAPQIAALRRADSVYSQRVRAVYAPLGEYLARGNGAAGKAEMDSANATSKEYWRIFWEQAAIADSILTPAQKELFPMLRRLVEVPAKEREHARWYFGHPVTMPEAAKRTSPRAP
jgi:hypothetical protein